MTNGEAGGCSNKVDADALLSMLQAAGVGPQHRTEFADSYVQPWADANSGLVTSIDLIYDVGFDAEDFGWIAATHALSDLYADLASPSVGMVCLGVPAAGVRNGVGAAILRGASKGFSANGSILGGGHTVYSDRTFMAVSVVGSKPFKARPQVSDGCTYSLLTSKPLGSGIYIAAMRNQLLTEGGRLEALATMKTSNRFAAESLSAVAEREFESLGFVTDITGFGAVMAAYTQTPAGWTSILDVRQVPLLKRAIRLVHDHGAVTNLGEKNWQWAVAESRVASQGVDDEYLLALNDPQTSGGLLAAVRDDFVGELLERGPWTRIGSVLQAQDAHEPTIVIRSH